MNESFLKPEFCNPPNDACILQAIFGDKIFFPQNFFDKFLATQVCTRETLNAICSNALFIICGFDSKNLNMVCICISEYSKQLLIEIILYKIAIMCGSSILWLLGVALELSMIPERVWKKSCHGSQFFLHLSPFHCPWAKLRADRKKTKPTHDFLVSC